MAVPVEKPIESPDVAADNGLSPEWREEIRRRSEEISQGAALLRDAENVFARAYAKLP
jgi:hypothetical protein